MIKDAQSSGESRKEAADENEAPSNQHGLGMIVEQASPDSDGKKGDAAIDDDTDLGSRPESSEHYEDVQLFIVVILIGFVFGVVFCALLWHT